MTRNDRKELVDDICEAIERSYGSLKTVDKFDTKNARSVLDVVESAITLVEAYSDDVETLSGTNKKKLVVEILNRIINVKIKYVHKVVREKVERRADSVDRQDHRSCDNRVDVESRDDDWNVGRYGEGTRGELEHGRRVDAVVESERVREYETALLGCRRERTQRVHRRNAAFDNGLNTITLQFRKTRTI